MRLQATLSTAQWDKLQSAFDQAVVATDQESLALIDRLRSEDPPVAEALSAMLSAHQRWSGQTGGAQDHLTTSVSAVGSLNPGDLIGPYRIVGELGHGGMGRVYLGERANGHVQQQVAIKIVQPGVLDAATRERFRLERELLASFNHPNIARLYDAGESAEGHPYFVMEYVRGETLTAYCDERQLPLRERLQLFLKVCEAVRYAHSNLVLHRDLKPGNVLVDEHGNPKLIDFGIAKPLRFGAEQLESTATQQRFFSPLNVAPEQLRGDRVGITCDVYQLGTVLYELLCGEPIFNLSDKTPAQIEEAILDQVPIAPRLRAQQASTSIASARHAADAAGLARQLRGDLDEITLLALRKEPESRYGSVEQLVDDIQRHLNYQPVQARGKQRWYRAARFAKRHWKALISGSIAALLAIGFIVTLTLQSQQLTKERDHAVSERRRSEEVTQFLIDVFKAADPSESLSRNTQVGVILDRGKNKLQSTLADEPGIRSRMLMTLAEVYQAIDDLSAAEQLGREALQVYEQSGDTVDRDLIDYLDRFSSILIVAGKYDTAKELADRALVIHAALGNSLAQTWQSQLNQLHGLFNRNEPEACKELFKLIGQLRNDPATNKEPFATAVLATSMCRKQSGHDVEQDIAMMQEALDVRLGIYGPDDPRTWSAKERLASMLSGAGKLEQVLPLYDDLVARKENLFGSDSLALANTLFGRGATYADLERIPQAEADYLRTKAIFEKAHGGQPHQDIAVILLNLANLYDDPLDVIPTGAAQANKYYESALHAAEAVFDARSTNLASFRSSYGNFKFRHGDLDMAESLFRKVIEVTPVNQPTGLHSRIDEAHILLDRGQRIEAEQLTAECEAAIRTNPGLSGFFDIFTALRLEVAAQPH